VVDSVRSIGVTDVTYYRWRSEFGGQYTDSSNPLVLTQERALFGAIGLRQDF
jgi:hypothetical protein